MRLLTIFCLLFSFGLMAKDYKSLQRLNEGDVISAEVFNDIMDRIELTLKPIAISEITGTWTAKQYVCKDGDYGPEFCDGGAVLGPLNQENEFRYKFDKVTIVDNNNGTFNFTAESNNLLLNYNFSNSFRATTGNLTHVCSLSPAQIIGCKSDSRVNQNGGTIAVFMNIKRTSPNQMVLFWGPSVGGYNFNHIILDKLNNPPEPPTNLAVTNADGTVSLSWTAPETYSLTVPGVEGTTPASQTEGAASSYKIQSKDAADGTYTELATATSNSYTDTITSGTTRWYRVYAVNEYGTSKGSNVVSISYSE